MLIRVAMNDGGQLARAGQLRPEMASLRLKVLAFVRGYIRAHGGSPSYGEIAAGLNTNRERVRKAVKRLIANGELARVPGPRGLALPDDERAALRRLEAAGWAIDPAARTVTNRPLQRGFDLDYVRGEPEGGRRAGGNSNPADGDKGAS